MDSIGKKCSSNARVNLGSYPVKPAEDEPECKHPDDFVQSYPSSPMFGMFRPFVTDVSRV